MVIKKSRFIRFFISLFLVQSITISCIFSTSGTSLTNSNFCDWFNKSQQIRADRIPAILKVQEVYEKYGTSSLDYSNQAMVRDMSFAMKDYLTTNEKFIEQWNLLGQLSPGDDYWENELQAVKLFNEGFSKAIEGMKSQNKDLINEGIKLYESGNIFSKQAEIDMVKFHKECD